MNWLATRLSEPSTWRGLIAAAGAFGITFTPEEANAIIAVGLALYGLYNVFKKEKSNGTD